MSSQKKFTWITLALFIVVGLTLISFFGCVEKERPGITQTPPGLSDEVTILVYVSDPENPNSLVIVPDSAYLVAERQKAHWLPMQGTLTDVTFKDAAASPRKEMSMKQGAGPRPGKPVCEKGNCKMMTPPNLVGTFPYSLSLQLNGRTYVADPQLIVGR